MHKVACVSAEGQHPEQAGGHGGGGAQAAAARLQESHAEAATGGCSYPAHHYGTQLVSCWAHSFALAFALSVFSLRVT